jgi:hypothetical protein
MRISSSHPSLGSSPPNPKSAHFTKLKELKVKTADSMPTTSELEETQCVVVSLHKSYDCAYNSVIFVPKFVRDGLDNFPHPDIPSLFEPMQTCDSILAEIESHPLTRAASDVPFINFPLNAQIYLG